MWEKYSNDRFGAMACRFYQWSGIEEEGSLHLEKFPKLEKKIQEHIHLKDYQRQLAEEDNNKLVIITQKID